MTIPAERYDIIVPKGAKFYQEFQQVDDNNLPISLEGKTLKCRIKKSLNSSEIYFDLTEANGGVVKVDEANGVFAILLTSAQTNITATNGLYDVILIDTSYPTIETERLLEGKVTFSPGVTPQ